MLKLTKFSVNFIYSYSHIILIDTINLIHDIILVRDLKPRKFNTIQ